MSLSTAAAASRRPHDRALVWTLLFVALLTAVRVAGLFLSPVELYPEEAQYWVWSRHLDLGYFSKPPLIAWLIHATTAVGGNREAWVRLSAPLAHALAALALQRAGARLYGGWTGFWAAVLYSLMPGVQLSSAAIATDAPMLMCMAFALWAYAGLLTTSTRRSALLCAGGVGLALGVGALAKYAALYLIAGLLLHALVDPQARRRWRPPELILASLLFLAALTPNLAWNVAHGFETVAHTAADAEWGDAPAGAHVHKARHFDPGQLVNFLVSQLGVFGPIPFVALGLAGAEAAGGSRRVGGEARLRPDLALLALAAPPLAIVAVQALISRANANWAAAAYVPASVLAAAWLTRPASGERIGGSARRWILAAAIASQAALGAVFFVAAVSPAMADRLGFANSFKRARGWGETTALVRRELAQASADGPVSAVAVDDRFLFNALAYYDRQDLAAPGAPPLRMWVRERRPHNEAETSAPLTAKDGQRVLFVSVVERYRQEAEADFTRVRLLGRWSIRLDAKHTRDVLVFVGEDYRRRPRDPRTGLPVLPSASATSPPAPAS